MKAVLCENWGPPESLIVRDIEPPVAGPGEVVINVRAVGLNFLDTLIIAGKYQFRPDFGFSPGAEFAGVISQLGEGVEDFSIGERVMAFNGWGAARERIAVKAHQLVRIPDEVAFETAAGMMVTYGTTYHGLRDRANIAAGETLAVLGAAGGVGQAAVEIGKAMGARVIACASSDEKLAFCKQCGADDLVNYSTQPLKEELKRLTGGKGVDVVYDPVGGALAEEALRATGWRGRYLVVGFASGDIPKIALNLVLLKGCEMMGVYWGEHVKREPELHRKNMQTLGRWYATGKIKPYVFETWPLEETAKALDAIARRKVRGKAIVVV